MRQPPLHPQPPCNVRNLFYVTTRNKRKPKTAVAAVAVLTGLVRRPRSPPTSWCGTCSDGVTARRPSSSCTAPLAGGLGMPETDTYLHKRKPYAIPRSLERREMQLDHNLISRDILLVLLILTPLLHPQSSVHQHMWPVLQVVHDHVHLLIRVSVVRQEPVGT